MYKGNNKLRVPVGCLIDIKSDGLFTVFGLEDGKRSLILGPFKSTARRLRAQLPKEIDHVEIKAAKSISFTVQTETKNKPDRCNPVPLEVAQPETESLRAMVQRFIRNEVHQQVEDEVDSFEDDDDFELDEEEHHVTPYTYIEMDEPIPEESFQLEDKEPAEETTPPAEETTPKVEPAPAD